MKIFFLLLLRFSFGYLFQMKHYSKPLMQRDEPNDAMFMAKSATRMALLGVSLSLLVDYFPSLLPPL